MSLNLGLGVGLVAHSPPDGTIFPNDGAVGFDNASVYSKTFTAGTISSSDTINLGVVYKPVENDVSYIACGSFPHTSGKSTSMKYPFQLQQRGTEQLRLTATGAKTSLQVNPPTIFDAGEFNWFGISGSITADLFTWFHYSATSGMTSGSLAATTNNGFPFEFLSMVNADVGALRGVTGSFSGYSDADIAQVFVGLNEVDYTDAAVRAAVLTGTEYKSFQNLEVGIIAHSGNTTTFPTNNATLYDTLATTSVTLTDETGPTPPFTGA